MNCFFCGAPIGEEFICPHCGTGQQIYRKVIYASCAAYNDGLHRAGIRDLSGAAEALNMSLKYNKFNTDARNLLGLVYFEVGETVLALREWVISKNLQPEGNAADAYLKELQQTGTLKKLDQTTRKFNQALSYCMQGSRDLARIQLRRVLLSQPKMVKAHQLLALICMQDGKYEEARKSLSAASKIDYKNPMTMEYMQEVRRTLKGKKKRRRSKTEVSEFSDVADSINLQSESVFNILDSTGSGIINVFVGIILGVLACIFLVVPSMRQDVNRNAASALVSANEQAANSRNNVATLEKQVDSLSAQLEEYTGKADVRTSYEKLLFTEDALESGDAESAKASVTEINRDLLDAGGQARYDAVMAKVEEQIVVDNYAAGAAAMKEGDYAKAVKLLASVVEADVSYDGGDALFALAQCCEKAEQFEDALAHYQRFVDLYPGTRRASTSQASIKRIVADTGLPLPLPTEEQPASEQEGEGAAEETEEEQE